MGLSPAFECRLAQVYPILDAITAVELASRRWRESVAVPVIIGVSIGDAVASRSYACPGTRYFSDSAGLGVMDIAALG